ncbi:nucleotide exchange factor GrpE [Eremococcus coleocola]|uniref:Protein GrpE n=1 Tax=Eremococcus coleocola ACS-139-V-Col8 TaxID=908337 RepID=E4KQB9_9LACT|nr:nucleotide exchange factor GrpE [Eremococcus coleocola]EFR30908.1 co-chaperone GrpE [Eremococcus coleocola ACS-139-V-Col8]
MTQAEENKETVKNTEEIEVITQAEETEAKLDAEAPGVETPEETDADQASDSDPVADLQAQVQDLENEKAGLEDKILRLQAEIANMKRINVRERQDAAKFRSQNLAQALLEGIDNLERALALETESEEGQQIIKGVEIAHKQLLEAFDKENIHVIDPLNQPFDPNFHQAVSMMPGQEGQESQTVIQVLQKGYELNERVLRPAMVIVAQ